MLFLKKVLPLFALPLGIAFLLLAFAWWRRKRWPVFAAAILLYLASLHFVGDGLLRQLESQYAAVPLAAVQPADAIVVLSGIFGPPVEEGILPNVSGSVERLEGGIRLFQQGSGQWLVFTGGRIPWDPRRTLEGERLRAEAIRRGVPAAKILVSREVGDTADEAQAIAELARERGWKRITLVTSASHMPRAMRLFRWAGVPVLPFPVDYQIDVNGPLTLLDFLPSALALARTEIALRECYGIAFYALTGR